MMVLKVHFTDTEIAEFFRNNGFTTAPHTRGRWVHGYHNGSKWMETEVTGVVHNGRTYDGEDIFQQVAEARMKRMVAPQNLETARTIERILKQKK